MGARCLTVMFYGDKEIAVLYRQFDGYPSGHGRELAEVLAPNGKAALMVNRLSLADGGQPRVFNGEACLAASIVAAFKREAGDFYLHPGGTRDRFEEFIYEVRGRETGKPPTVKAMKVGWTQTHSEQGELLAKPIEHPAKVIFKEAGADRFYVWAHEQM